MKYKFEHREIKFRAWNNVSQVMVPMNAILMRDGEFKVGIWNNEETEIVEEEEFELMQYTGLKDANGNEIFEGDLIKDKHGNILLISWDDQNGLTGMGGWDFQDVKNTQTKFARCNECEIVGNVFETPGLLGEGAK